MSFPNGSYMAPDHAPRAFDTGEIQAFVYDLDPADLVLDEAAGLALPPDPPTLKDVMGPRDRGRRA
jgi:hypothetical protein